MPTRVALLAGLAEHAAAAAAAVGGVVAAVMAAVGLALWALGVGVSFPSRRRWASLVWVGVCVALAASVAGLAVGLA